MEKKGKSHRFNDHSGIDLRKIRIQKGNDAVNGTGQGNRPADEDKNQEKQHDHQVFADLFDAFLHACQNDTGRNAHEQGMVPERFCRIGDKRTENP